MLADTVIASLLVNMLERKAKILGREVIRAVEGTIRTGQEF